ncbi:MAG: rod shape-determining protein MreC [Firmicutes bacterium]|nr:rod shape-determining protein MreC [Bacillota bacterium]
MLQTLWRWKYVIAIVIIFAVIGTIHFTSSVRDQLTFGERVMRDVVAPVQRLFMKANHFFDNVYSSLAELGSIRERNQELEELVLSLQQEVNQLAEYRRENVWLREALDFKDTAEFELMVAEVIGRSPNNWMRSITINKGSKQGVKQGMAVVSASGIVGTVQEVTSRTATVLLSTDPASAVGGLVQKTGDLLLVEGDSNLSGRLIAKPLNRDMNLAVGDMVVTSGLSWYFPKGIAIGVVTEVVEGKYEYIDYAVIEPAVDFSRLEYVFVVLQDTD